jgi:hypothetical protein
MGKVLAPQMDGKASVLVEDGIWKDRLSSWDFAPRSPAPTYEGNFEDGHALAVYHGAPRVLELGCSDGTWCFGTWVFLSCPEAWLTLGLSQSSRKNNQIGRHTLLSNFTF